MSIFNHDNAHLIEANSSVEAPSSHVALVYVKFTKTRLAALAGVPRSEGAQNSLLSRYLSFLLYQNDSDQRALTQNIPDPSSG